MHIECLMHMSKAIQKDFFFFTKGSNFAGKNVPSIPVYSLISPSNIKYENKININ